MNPTLPLSRWLDPDLADEPVFINTNAKQLTRGQLRQQVIAQSKAIQTSDAQRWALCFDDTGAFIVALLAALHVGRTVIIPGNLQVGALRQQSSEFDAVLSDRADLQTAFPQHLKSPAQPAAIDPQDDRLPALPPDATLVLFTSGTTGVPRRIQKTVAAMDQEAHWLAALFYTELHGCVLAASVSHQHLYGLSFRVFLPMALRLPLYTKQIHYPEQLPAHDPDRTLAFVSSPAFLKRLDTNLPASQLAWLMSAGGVLDASSAALAVHCLGVWPCEIYGSTETGVLAWRRWPTPGATWQAFPRVKFFAQQDQWRVTSPLIDSPTGWMLEDQLAFNPSGQFILLGRKDRIVKIEEKRVSLDEIEQRVCRLPGIKDAAAVYLQRDGRQGLGIVLSLTEPGQDHSATIQEQLAWRQQLRQWLEPVAIPRYWRVVAQIPCNSMGKRTQAQLQELFL